MKNFEEFLQEADFYKANQTIPSPPSPPPPGMTDMRLRQWRHEEMGKPPMKQAPRPPSHLQNISMQTDATGKLETLAQNIKSTFENPEEYRKYIDSWIQMLHDLK